MKRLFVLLQHLLPQRLLTSAAGALARNETLATVLIRLFIRQYRVDMSEALRGDPSSYRDFNEFFTRELKPGARPLATAADAVLCPADGAVSELGPISSAQLLQAKGRYFDLVALLGGDGELAQALDGGQFLTIYLSPRDYHRVHMPLQGRLLRAKRVPGALFSVNETSTALIPDLFNRNERMIGVFEGEFGRFAVIMVGAMIVGGIRTVWDESDGAGCAQKNARDFGGDGPRLRAGAEMGRFELGSTVILLFPPDTIEFARELEPGKPVRMGGEIGRRIGKPD